MLFRADELFQISIYANAVFPLNLKFSAKEPIRGSGKQTHRTSHLF